MDLKNLPTYIFFDIVSEFICRFIEYKLAPVVLLVVSAALPQKTFLVSTQVLLFFRFHKFLSLILCFDPLLQHHTKMTTWLCN